MDRVREHYVKPMNEFYRKRYKEIFDEEPPEDMKVVMDRMIEHGEVQMDQIIDIVRKEEKA